MPRYTENRLVLIRQRAGFKTSAKAAEALGVGTYAVVNVENGVVPPSGDLVARMSAVYSASTLEIREAINYVRLRWLSRHLARAKDEAKSIAAAKAVIEEIEKEVDETLGQ